MSFSTVHVFQSSGQWEGDSKGLCTVNCCLILKAPIMTAADDSLEYFFIIFRENKARYFM